MPYAVQAMNEQKENLAIEDTRLTDLIDFAYRSGATAVALVPVENICVEDRLAERCREPRCENYGLSGSCPPHVPGPGAMRSQLKTFKQAIFFKIDIPSDILYSSGQREIFQLLHEIAAGIEQQAVSMGFVRSKAYAGSSCKQLFCGEHLHCQVVTGKGPCRHPRLARPSMSGFGIHVAKLMESVGWSMVKKGRDTLSEPGMASVSGLVLIG